MHDAPVPAPEPPPQRLHGFLRLLPFVLAALALAWLALDALVFHESARHLRDLERVSELHRTYRRFTEAEARMKEGTDKLTQAVRRYAATGRPEFIADYEQEEKVDRNRERAIAIVEEMPGVDPTALRMLHESMEHSLGLQDDEHRAMRLVAEATGLPRERMPQHLLDVALTPEEEALSPAEKRQRAVDMLYDESYFAAKSNIWDSAARFLDGTIGRSVDDFDETTKRTIRSVARQMVLFTLALAVVFALLVIAASVGYALFSRLNRTNLALVAELRRERDATLAAEKAKSMFFSMVSHDIRTPLNSIIGFSEMLRDGVADPAERADHVENILFSSHTLLALVNDVLDLSKLDAEKMKFSYAPCDFPALLGRVAASFRIQTARKGIGLRADCGAMPRLLLDEERLRQVLVNLVGNAVKFTDEGSVELRAAFAPDPAAPGRGELRFSVRDTGVGIAPEDQPRVMEPFVQVGAGGASGGTGLGLPICHRLLLRMGGRLDLESRPGEGSTFTAVLPGVETAPEPGAAPAGAAAPAPPPAPARPVRSVLVVDDVPVNLLVEQAMLKRAGIADVETAPSGAAALEALERHGPFDLVLSDLWMPEMDGYALCARLRADARWKGLPVYAVTADVEARKAALERGFDGLLLKPLTAEALARFLAAAGR